MPRMDILWKARDRRVGPAEEFQTIVTQPHWGLVDLSYPLSDFRLDTEQSVFSCNPDMLKPIDLRIFVKINMVLSRYKEGPDILNELLFKLQ